MKTTRRSTAIIGILFIMSVFAGCPSPITPPSPSDQTSDQTAPAEVTGLTAVAGVRRVVLGWTAPSDADFAGVTISFTPAAASVTQPITVAQPAASYTVEGLAENTAYTFTVKTRDTSGNVSAGTSVSAQVGDDVFAWFVAQPLADTDEPATAVLDDGTLTVHSTYSASGNAYKYIADYGNYGGFVGFVVAPEKLTGDFSIEATIDVVQQNKLNNASGIGVGMFDGFEVDGNYALILMRNSNNTAQGYYTKGEASVGTGGINVAYTAGTAMTLRLSRTGSTVAMTVTPEGGSASTWSGGASNFYGTATDPVYVGITFANVDAVVTDFVITDADGQTVFDSSDALLADFVPSSLSVGTEEIDLPLGGGSRDIEAVARAEGGAVAGVSVSGHDTAIVTASASNGADGSVITLTPVASGFTTLTVTNTADPARTKTITVSVSAFPETDPYGPLTTVYPAAGAVDAYTDGELAISFDTEPILNPGGTIRILTADGTEVDSIAFSGESQSSWGSVINVGAQMVRADGNTLSITPHFGVLANDTEYWSAVPVSAITAELNGQAFTGLSNDPAESSWSFTTRSAPVLAAGSPVTVDGAQNSTAHFRTVQGALDALAGGLPAETDVTIRIAAGTYTELLYYKGGKNITLLGPEGNDRGDTAIIRYTNSAQMNGSTHTRASAYFSASNLVLRNVTLQNTWVRTGGDNQAEAIFFANGTGKTLAAYNSSFISNQDTIQTTGRTWFYDCAIEGNTDFIWGSAEVSLFEHCSLRVVNDGAGSGTGYIFVSRTPLTSGAIGKGYVLLDSTVTVDSGIVAYFGRNAGGSGFYDQAALVGVSFDGAGSIGPGKWYNSSVYYAVGDASYIGWKSADTTGLNVSTAGDRTGTSTSVAAAETEYATRGAILNRVVVYDGTTTGYADAASIWDLSDLETDFGIAP